MFRLGSPLHSRMLNVSASAVLVCALAASTAAGAQTLNAPGQIPPDVPSQSAPANSAAAEVSAKRGLFLALIAQGVGEIGSTLWKGLRGSMTKWFSRDPGPDSSGSLEHGAGPVTRPPESAPLHAGIAYEVHLIGRDGAARPVDPARHVFRTNDEFVVYYRPSLPGRVKVLDIDPRGNEIAHRCCRGCGRPARNAGTLSVRREQGQGDADSTWMPSRVRSRVAPRA